MERIILIYDDLAKNEVEKVIIPLFGKNLKLHLPYKNFMTYNFSEEDFIVCYISDSQLKEVLPIIMENHCKIGFLPHPKAVQTRQGYGIPVKIESAVETILKSEEVLEVDLLMANGTPVLNTLVVGNSLSLMYGSIQENFIKRVFEKAGNLFRLFKRIELHRYQLNWSNEKGDLRERPVETAALGMVIVQHGKTKLLSRRILEDSYVNDGLMHNLILAPKSVSEMMRYVILGMIKSHENNKLPSFVSLLKTNVIHINSKEPMNYSLDETLMTARELELRVLPKALSIIPGPLLKTEENLKTVKVFKVDNLPKGELREELLKKSLPLINHATTQEFRWLFSILRKNSATTSSYLVLMALSTIIATLGLFGNSSPVIIGAMILAPLMAPIVSLSMGVLRQDNKLMQYSLQTIGFGLLIGYFFAVLITWFSPLEFVNEEIQARTRPNLLDLGVAAGSGVAGAYAHAKREIAQTLAGVAIAVALVPPLAVSGIGLGWGDWEVFWGALLLLGTNLAGMVFSGAFTFLMMGFSPFRLARKGLLISLFMVGVISAPLALGFTRMVRENRIIQRLSGKEIQNGILRDVRVLQMNPIKISITLVSENSVDLEEIKQIKEEIIEMIGEDVQIELMVGIQL
jgi:uncharacterized hydrophobic protein (TIGR00271 family)